MPKQENPDQFEPDGNPADESSEVDAADSEIIIEIETEASELSAADQLATHVNTVKNFLRSTAGLAIKESVQFHIDITSVAMLAALTAFYVNTKEVVQNARTNRLAAGHDKRSVCEGRNNPGDS